MTTGQTAVLAAAMVLTPSLRAQVQADNVEAHAAMPESELEKKTVPLGIGMDLLRRRSLLSTGNTARLQRVLAKARRGEPVTIGVIGGSITQGAKASAPAKRYGNRVAEWWRATFPEAQTTCVNAGVGGTGSSYGCLRVGQDLLQRKPDLVIVEFGVNDSSARARSRHTLEGLVRQILSQPNTPAVMLLFMMTSKPHDFPELEMLAMPGADLPEKGRVYGLNVQHWHRQIGEHYGLPMISFRDAVWPEIASAKCQWTDVIADAVHPNDLGHAITADLICSFLAKTASDLAGNDDLPSVHELPHARFSGRFVHVDYHTAGQLKPSLNTGWRMEKGDWHGAWWTCGKPGAVLEVDFEGTGLLAVLCLTRNQAGGARFRVDNGPWQKQNGWHGGQWPALVVVKDLADGLPHGDHTLRMEMTGDTGADDGSFAFRLHALAATGAQAK